ncbi:conserved hypothetical protein [Candidatus Methanoperedens nitroreducens]|uniref:DUF4349 domain-containing protein n=2 Tax=Candidatus Methanoperedens nitratireducens TaxID=1392998 RepID=A0A284VTD5_9EURY|nr:conserved hypothetical protein [Candidatus Methanoperedens nitroreducens]
MYMNNKYVVIFAFLLLIVTAGCISNQKFSYQDSLTAGIPLTGMDYSLQDEGTANNKNTIPVERKIISSAYLHMEVDSAESAVNKITNITQAHGGFISSSSQSSIGGRNNGQVTLRVPQADFYPAIEEIEALGTVGSKQVSGQDVTGEFIDLDARLGNLKKQELRLQEILKTAVTVKDVLEVEHELERVRGEIERLTGRLNFLNQSVEMSTIMVSAVEPTSFVSGGSGVVDTLRQAAGGFIESLRSIVIFTGYILPILLFIALILIASLGIKRKIVPRFRT